MTDVHGSERTYRKFVNSAKFYKVDHLVMGGDIEGKFLVPIVDEGAGHYRVTLQEELSHLDGHDELNGGQGPHRDARLLLRDRGEDEIRAMQADQSLVDAAFKKEAHARLERWIALADERLAGTDIKMYVTGGNDDPQELIDTLEEKQSERVINCEGRIVMLDDTFPMANCGYSNPDAVGHPAGDGRRDAGETPGGVRSRGSTTSRARSSTSTYRPTTRRSTSVRSSTGRPIHRRRSSSAAWRSRRRPAATRSAMRSSSISRCFSSAGTSTKREVWSRSSAPPW